MEVTVKRNNLRTSPTKVRPTLYLVRGKNAKHALDILKFTNKDCAQDLYKLIKSGIAAARELEMKEDDLYVKIIKCDAAGVYKRHRYGSRGRVVKIIKRNSHLTATISDEIKVAPAKEAKPEVKPEAKADKSVEKEAKPEAKAEAKKPKKSDK